MRVSGELGGDAGVHAVTGVAHHETKCLAKVLVLQLYRVPQDREVEGSLCSDSSNNPRSRVRSITVSLEIKTSRIRCVEEERLIELGTCAAEGTKGALGIVGTSSNSLGDLYQAKSAARMVHAVHASTRPYHH